MTEERYRHKKRLPDAKRETFEVPEGYEAVRDADGRATGEVRKVDPTTTANVVVIVDAIMEQAQVFASTYSLVGGRFDDGTKYQQSEDEKAELRRMIEAATEDSDNG